MATYKIAFFDVKPYDRESFNTANQRFHFEIKYFSEKLTLETSKLAKGFDVVCVFVNDPVTSAIIDSFVKLGVKLIALCSAGYNHVDLKAAKGKIPVVRVPEYSPHSVAEHAVGMMLCLNRKFNLAYCRVKENNFSIEGLKGFDMYNKTVGVIGAGRIGKAAIGILKGFGMRVIAYDVDPKQVQKADCPFVDLETVYRKSDIITLHCPLTQDNKHMIDSRAIEKMKDGVMIINTARGGLIKTKDLIEGLESKKIGFAGLDVYENEADYFYKDLSKTELADDNLARLQTFPNVLITSHQAYFTQEALDAIASITLNNVKEFFEGKPLKNEISYTQS